MEELYNGRGKWSIGRTAGAMHRRGTPRDTASGNFSDENNCLN
jgi:hypothetical protein